MFTPLSPLLSFFLLTTTTTATKADTLHVFPCTSYLHARTSLSTLYNFSSASHPSPSTSNQTLNKCQKNGENITKNNLLLPEMDIHLPRFLTSILLSARDLQSRTVKQKRPSKKQKTDFSSCYSSASSASNQTLDECKSHEILQKNGKNICLKKSCFFQKWICTCFASSLQVRCPHAIVKSTAGNQNRVHKTEHKAHFCSKLPLGLLPLKRFTSASNQTLD